MSYMKGRYYPPTPDYEDDDGDIDIEACDLDDDDDDDLDVSERRHHASGGSGSSGLADQNDEGKRDHHNQLERKRRASIKNSFNSLREVIPDIKGSKASRAVILQKAVEYIDDLKGRNKAHSRCVETLRRQNDTLEREVITMDEQIRREDLMNGSILPQQIIARQAQGLPSQAEYQAVAAGGDLDDGSGSRSGSGGSSPGADGEPPAPKPTSSKRMRYQ